jgi:Tfp pilus assembly protein PilP
VAQTPAAADKSAAHNTQVKVQPAPSSAKPAANLKVIAVPAKPSAVVAKTPAPKPTVLAVQPVAKPASSSQPKTANPAGKIPVVAAKPVPAPAPAAVVPKTAQKATPTVKAVAVPVAPAKGAKDPFAKNKPLVTAAKPGKSAGKPGIAEKIQVGAAPKEEKPVAEKKPETKTTAAGRRDPFISPVVRMSASGGSGCSSGKRCLAIDQIALKGVVKSDSGMIAVVVNAMDKAYFLRENDPVFNGYVTKITPDSIIFKETFHDRVGKELTRDVTKTISRPAA